MNYPFYTDLTLNKNQVKDFAIDNRSTAPTSPVEGQTYYDTVSKKYFGWNGTAWIDLSQTVNAPTTIKGEIANADTNPAYPSSPTTGDTYFITTNAGTVGGQTVEIGDMLVYGNSGWFILQRNLQAATVSLAGYMRLATQAEANAGSLNNVAIAPSTLAGFLSNYLYSRKVVNTIATLAANTETTVTHGLGLVSQDDVHVQCFQANQLIGLQVKTTSANAITVASNSALSNVKVVVIG